MVTQSRKTYYRDENISLDYELEEGAVLIHSLCKKFTLSVYKTSIDVFANFLNECHSAGLQKAYTVTPNPKFAKMFGGVSVNSFQFLNKEYEVIEWDLEQQH